MLIQDLLSDDKPRERLLSNGAQYLSDAELLALLLRTGVQGKSAVELARDLLKKFGGLCGLLVADKKQLCAVSGVGLAKYCQIQAASELMRRQLYAKLMNGPVLNNTKAAKRFLALNLNRYSSEVFAVLLLDNQHRLLVYKELFFGTVNASAIYPREVVKLALEHNAAAVIAAHNHPSGTEILSAADKAVTKILTEALALIDVKLLEHFVITHGSF